MKLYVLPIITLALAAGSCPPDEPVISTPPPEWTAPVEEPLAPLIPEDATDEEADAAEADFMSRLYDAFQAAQNKLKRLDEWRAKVSE